MPHTPRILLVDDLETNLVALSAVLSDVPAQLVTAQSGEDALKRLLEHEFAVVLLDVQMPGMDGFETAQMIRQRERSRHTPIIFVTAINKADTHVSRGYSLGAVDYIFKPIVPEVLKAKVLVFVDLFSLRHAERKAAEALRAKTQELERSNAALAEFVHVAAHDMQEPLRTVTRYLKLLSRRYRDKLDRAGGEFIDAALLGSEQMLTLIQDLLEYSRIGSTGPTRTKVDVESILAEATSRLKRAIEESGAVITHDPLPVIMADEREIARVFQNLIGNAIKFRGEATPRIHVTADTRGSTWVFQVKDNGVGIPPESRERVFELFERLHGRHEYSGTGVGLSICKRIVENHGGQIWVDANPGGGSVFTFAIPSPDVSQP